MADKKISQLTGATTPLAGTEVLPIVQSGSTVKVSAADVTAGRAISASSLALTGSPLAATSGGTGQSSAFTANGVVYASSTSALSTSSNLTFASDNLSIGPAGSSLTWGRFVSIDATYPGVVLNSTAGGGKKWSIGADASVLTFRNETDTATRAELSAIGDLKLNAGNLVVGTAAKGIDFSANTGAAGMTSELLNWYEEGTWTPVVKDAAAGNAATAAASSGYYTRVGRLVHFTIRLINIDTTGLTAGNQIHITGLPFAVSGTTGSSAFLAEAVDISSTAGSLYAHVDGGTTYFVMFNGTTTGQSNAIVSQITSGSGQLFINGTYVTA